MKAFTSRRDFLKAAGVTAAAAALAGCSSSSGSASGSAAGGKTIKIGVFEPASGDNGAGGKQEVLAIEYANSIAPTVDIGGETYKVELVYADNGSDSAKHRLNHCKLFLHAVDIFDIRRHIISHRPNRV